MPTLLASVLFFVLNPAFSTAAVVSLTAIGPLPADNAFSMKCLSDPFREPARRGALAARPVAGREAAPSAASARSIALTRESSSTRRATSVWR